MGRYVVCLVTSLCCVASCRSGQEEEPASGQDTSSALDSDDTGHPNDTVQVHTGAIGIDTQTGDSTDTSEAAEETGAITCALPTAGYYQYSEISVEGECGTDTTILDIYGFTVGFSLAVTGLDTFALSYDGFSLEPTCTLAADCNFTCSAEEGYANLGIIGISAKLGYMLQSTGTVLPTGALEGAHAFTLSCDGSESNCAEVSEVLIGAPLPCSGEVPWAAALNE